MIAPHRLTRLLTHLPHLNWHQLKASYALLAPFLWKRRSAYAGLLLFMLIDIGLTLAFAWFIGSITDAAVQGRYDQLRWLVPLGILLTVLNVGGGYFNRLLHFWATVGVKKDLKEDLLQRVLRLPAERIGKLRSGAVMTHFTEDLHGIEGMIGGSLIQLIRLPLIFTAVFIYMFHIHWTLSLLSMAVLPIAIVSGLWFGTMLRNNNRKMHLLAENANSLLNETFLGTLVVRSFTMERRLHRKFAEENSRLFELETKDTKLRGRFAAGGEAAGSAAFIISICVGAYLVTDNILSIGSLMSFVNLTNHLIYPITGLAGLWAGFQSSLTSMERLMALVEDAPLGEELPDYTKPPILTGQASISFEEVTFQYESGASPVFERFQLAIPGGQHVALVGPSGAGKTTLFNLLMGFYQPQSGTIRIGGISIDAMSPSQLRSSIAYVTQEPFLFSGTIRDNLTLAHPDRSERDMIEAAKKAQLHDFILSLPQGYDTEIGERGVKLSGGQKQRLAIARAILKNAPILLLDEATSSLDTMTEHEVQDALHALMRHRTTLTIAHRLSTVQDADMIIVLDQGTIPQSGTHDQLVAAPGLYRELHHRQHFSRRSNAR